MLIACEHIVLDEPEADLPSRASHVRSASRPSIVPAMSCSPGTCHTTSGAIRVLTRSRSPARKASAVRLYTIASGWSCITDERVYEVVSPSVVTAPLTRCRSRRTGPTRRPRTRRESPAANRGTFRRRSPLRTGERTSPAPPARAAGASGRSRCDSRASRGPVTTGDHDHRDDQPDPNEDEQQSLDHEVTR